MVEQKDINVLAICQRLKNLWHFEFFMTTRPYGAGNFKTVLLLQFSSDLGQAYDNTAVKGKNIKLWMFSDLPKILLHFEILTWESIGNSKICNILKTADRRAESRQFGLQG